MEPALQGGAVREQLDRILKSPGFVQSERMGRFLRLIVEYTISARAGELKEYLIGTEVFDRRETYDPRLDPIVRVEARRLRRKLEEYYEGEGRVDRIRIELPKGTYVPAIREAAVPEPVAAPAETIAVLPLQNLSPDADNEYFSDGLTEELIYALTKTPGLKVVAWNSAAQWKGRGDDAAAVAQELRVRYVLSGSVRRAGGRVRILVRLVDGRNGQYLWSEMYDRGLEDLFSIQQEIAEMVAGTLQIRLAPPQRAYNAEAYNCYLRGRYECNKRTRGGLEVSLRCYEQALEIDPNLALAHAAIADSNLLLADYGFARPETAIPTAKAAAARALAIDPTLGEAETTLALILGLYEWRWKDAEFHYRRALELNPNYATAHHWYAVDHLILLGRCEEAARELALARELDPLSPIVREGAGYMRVLARQFGEAVEEYRAMIAQMPGFYKFYSSLARVYTLMGRFDDAIELLHKAMSIGGEVPNIFGALGQTYALAGDRKRALEMLERLHERAERMYVMRLTLGIVHMGLGDLDRALDYLEESFRNHEPALPTINVHPLYDPLRNSPRFRKMVEATGLVWRPAPRTEASR